MSKMGGMSDIRYGAIRSRRMLIDAVNALSPFKDAITVVGAHAVHEWVKEAWGSVDMEATRDADITINPSFISDNPSIIETLKNIGLEPALRDRPGIYGLEIESSLPLEARTTFDILVPECYAGGGNRAARISGQKNTTSIFKNTLSTTIPFFNLQMFYDSNKLAI